VNVCHITSVHPSNDIRIFVKQCSTLVIKGVKVTLLATHDKDEIVNGVAIKALPKRSSAFTRILLNLPLILFYTWKEKFDIYHAHDPELIPVLFMLKVIGRTVVYDMHENFPKQLESKKLSSKLKAVIGFIWPKFEYMALRKMGVVFAETSYKDDYVYVKSYVDVLNMPLVDDLRELEAVKHSRFTLGYVGGVSEDRYCVKILEALIKLQNNGVDIGFECVGPINCKATKLKINRLCSKLSNVHFYGSLPPHDAWKKMIKCHVGIAVLMPKPNYVRSYPTKLFEYLAMGMPVITSNFELYKPIVAANKVGICVDPLKPEEFELAIREFLGSKELLNVMSINTKRRFEADYNWDNELKKLLTFYNEIV